MAQRKKRLTQREKAERAAAKKWAQENGLLPPDKPRLNRKKFARETWAAYMKEVSPEEVGVLKLLKLAVEYGAFLKKLDAEGRDKYTVGELIDEVILPITNL